MALLALPVLVVASLQAQVPQIMNYQGQVAVGNARYDGTGQFKFALVNAAGDITYWSHNGTSTDGAEPTGDSIPLTITKGQFSVALGDTAVAGMTEPLSPSVFLNDALYLRVWFSHDGSPFEQLTPDLRIASVAYAMTAANAVVPDGSITAAKLADGAVTSSKIASGAVTQTELAAGAVTAAHIADHSITADQLAGGTAANNLLASGQAAVPIGGIVLSDDYNDTDLIGAGFVKLGGGAVTIASYWEHRADGLGISVQPVPTCRYTHTAVWTGSEMIIWGGFYRDPGGSSHAVHDGGRYDPAADSWTTMSTVGAPSARSHHTAVWSGSEMIVWGGNDRNDGRRYDPVTDSWTPISTYGAPVGRSYHTAVWTGSEMIIWGGYSSGNYLNDGGRYDPTSDSWAAVSPTGAPSERQYHTSIWTSSEMIVWGGYYYDGSPRYLGSGGRYDPVTDTWTVVSPTDAPAARYNHTAVWTGDKMIVWGGSTGGVSGDGSSYDPETDSWMAINTTDAPAARYYHEAVWTGDRMIVWGGVGIAGYLDTGGIYDPSAGQWTAVSTIGAPAGRYSHTAVWTGSEMIIWGGLAHSGSYTTFADGGRYNPSTDSWLALEDQATFIERIYHTAVWTGSEMIIWGGYHYDGITAHYLNDGGRYDSVADSWTPVSTTDAPAGRDHHTAVWTGNEMIIWGGYEGSYLNDGGRYDPVADAWASMSTTDTPAGRNQHTAVWTGSQMIVWGGYGGGGSYLSDGGRYDPVGDSWTTTSTTDAPAGRNGHTAVWTGDKMIVWGGYGGGYRNDGGLYDPAADSWTPTPTTGAPLGRRDHTGIWTGSEMIVWGGYDYSYDYGYGYRYHFLNTGARYVPDSDQWVALPSTSLHGRAGHTAVWTGNEMIVWGGYYGSSDGSNRYGLSDGGRYRYGSWQSVPGSGPAARMGHTAVWTGDAMLVWGGINLASSAYYKDTFAYYLDKVLYYYQKLQ